MPTYKHIPPTAPPAGALLDLHLLTNLAAVNKVNCAKVNALGQHVLLVLEAAGGGPGQ